MRNQIKHWASTLGHHPEDWHPPSLARLCSQHFDPLQSFEGSKSTSSTPTNHPLPPSDNHIKLVRSEAELDYWKSIKGFYDDGLFCDLKIVCLPEDQEDSVNEGKLEEILCHSIVLAALSPMIGLAALDAVNNEEPVLYLVDYDQAEVRLAIDTLYSCLEKEKDMEELTHGNVGKVFSALGVDWSRFPKSESETKQIRFEHNYNHAEYVVDDVWEHDSVDISGASEIEDSDWDMKEDVDDSSEEVGGELSEVENPRHKKRKRAKSVEENDSKRSKVTLENLNSMHNQLIAEQGVVNVELLSKPFNARLFAIRFDMMAMLGLQQTKGGMSHFNAVPLAVSPKNGEQATADDIKHYYYDRFRPAVQAVFGLSEVEATGSAICYRMGLPKNIANTIAKKKYEYKRTYINYSKEELQKLLTDEVISANQTALLKPRFDKGLFDSDKISGIRLRLNLISGMSSDMEGIILVTCKDGEFSAQTLSVSEDSRQKDVAALLKTFFDVFTVHERTGTPKYSKVEKVDSMIEEANASTKLQALYIVVQDYLNGSRNSEESLSGLGRKVCETCKEEFVLCDINDMANYRSHKRRHFYDNYNCNCGLEFKTVDDRQSHIQLVHLKGYSLCTKCTFVGNNKCLREHMEDRHKEFSCEQCGESFEGRIKFKNHMESACAFIESNLDSMPVKQKARMPNNKPNNQQFENHKCDCDIQFANFDEKKKHVQLVHMKNYLQCPEPKCARVMRKALLREHVKRLHKPTSCEKCGMDFEGTTAYSHHMRYKHNDQVLKTSAGSSKKSKQASSLYVTLSPFHPHPNCSEVPQQTEPCADCGKTFDRPRQLYCHWNDHHRESRCLECGINFTGDHQRKLHTKKFHKPGLDDSGPVICEECGSTLANVGSLRKHMKGVHGQGNSQKPKKSPTTEKEVFICEHCNLS